MAQEQSEMNQSGQRSDDASEGEETNDNLVAVADDVQENIEGKKTTVGELLDSIENRGFGPLILLPAFISATPIGGIPGMSIVTGTLIIIIAIQMLFTSGHPWIPRRIEKFEISEDRVENGIRKARPWIKWIDKFVHERWTFLVTGPMHFVVAFVLIALSASYFPLALIPGGVMVPGLANTLFAIAITARDGVVMLAGLLMAAATGYMLFAFWPF